MIKEKEEVWKTVPGYDKYMISDRGRVKSLNYNRTGKERVMRATLSNGYFTTALSKEGRSKTFPVHKLVAIAFLDHIPCGHDIEINHINGVKNDNNLSNLEILTKKEHVIVSWKSRDKTSAYTGVSWSKSNKKWKAQVRVDGKQICIGHFEDEILASEAYQKKYKINLQKACQVNK